MNDADRSLMGRLSQALGTAYTVEGEIGRGGMGVVYNARDERLKRRVAIKVLPPELAFREEIRTRFLREAETAARLSHPHIVPIFSVGEGPDGLVYFVMAYIDGEPLAGKLQRRGTLPPEEARRIMLETVDALSAAHAIGVVHRDVKPDNILLEGSRGRVVVTDFGIAKALSSTTGGGSLTGTGVAIGTPHYMSPEQAAGDREIDGRSDLYSLGVVGYQMLVGELPFTAPTVPGILMKQITEDAPHITERRPDCPEELAACVMRCLEKEPERRWPSADGLRRALESRATPAYRSPPRIATRPASRRATGAGMPPLPAGNSGLPVPRSPDVPRRSRSARGRRDRPLPVVPGEPPMVSQTRGAFVSWVSVSGGCILLDAVMGWHGWSLFVLVPWGAFGILPRFMRLWNAGYSWRDVFDRPVAPDAAARKGVAGGAARALGPATADDFGAHVTTIEQSRRDREAIFALVDRLPASERKMLPDVVPTVDALLARAENLARMLHTMSADVDPDAVARLDAKIESTKRQPEGAERDRQLGLLERQRQALADLVGRRQGVAEQLESCVLAMQNVRFDLLRLKSAGIAAVLGDLTQATQQARSLSRDVDHAIAAADEIDQLLKR
ncbi:MAG TPA: serine/threonine-protein kinase [Gemmatimonadales bacterium]